MAIPLSHSQKLWAPKVRTLSDHSTVTRRNLTLLDTGFVMATDVADENYGSPLTIEQNQTCMISRAPSNLIDRFDFKMQTTVDELFRDHPEYENYFK